MSTDYVPLKLLPNRQILVQRGTEEIVINASTSSCPILPATLPEPRVAAETWGATNAVDFAIASATVLRKNAQPGLLYFSAAPVLLPVVSCSIDGTVELLGGVLVKDWTAPHAEHAVNSLIIDAAINFGGGTGSLEALVQMCAPSDAPLVTRDIPANDPILMKELSLKIESTLSHSALTIANILRHSQDLKFENMASYLEGAAARNDPNLSMITSICSYLPEFLNFVQPRLLIKNIWTGLGNSILGVFAEVGNSILSSLNNVLGAISSVLTMVGCILGAIGSCIGNVLNPKNWSAEGVANVCTNPVNNCISSGTTAIQNHGNAAVNGFNSLFTTVIPNFFSTIFSGFIAALLDSILSPLVEGLVALSESLMNAAILPHAKKIAAIIDVGVSENSSQLQTKMVIGYTDYRTFADRSTDTIVWIAVFVIIAAIWGIIRTSMSAFD